MVVTLPWSDWQKLKESLIFYTTNESLAFSPLADMIGLVAGVVHAVHENDLITLTLSLVDIMHITRYTHYRICPSGAGRDVWHLQYV